MTENGIREIAVFVAGTDEEYQSSMLTGITDAAIEHNINVSVFTSYGGVLSSKQYDIGEYNIYSLAPFSRFDGAILLTNTICDTDVRKMIYNGIKEAGIPAVALDNNENPEFYDICIDNAAAMHEIIEHVITQHGAKVLNYISGPLENPEACSRLEAFRDVMRAHQLPVDEDRIFMGSFRPIDGKCAAEQILSCGLPLPDAIIAANDAMALEAVSVLEEHGVRVPEDVIVTGFDYTYYAQHHSPSLSTVARPLYDAGKAACDLLMRIISGEPCEKTVTLGAHPVYQESCGCVGHDEIDIKKYKKSTYALIKTARSDASLLNRMTSALAMSESSEDNISIISKYLHEINCEECCICLCENWENAFNDDRSGSYDYQVRGYTQYMSAPLIWKKSEISTKKHFKSEMLYPIPFTDGGHVSYFFPLHFSERCLGYYIFTNTPFPIKSMLCHSFMMNISNSFENIRKLIHLNNAIRELDRLYVADPLCEIYNRNGFIRLADERFKECLEQQQELLISFIDMDGLKYINDNYGHDEGDFALRRLASVIQSCCFGNQICARFGGDEFIVVGSGATNDDVAEFEIRFRKRLSETNAVLAKPYSLSASIGTFVTKVTPDMKLFSLITRADKLMYEQKKLHHKSRFPRKNAENQNH